MLDHNECGSSEKAEAVAYQSVTLIPTHILPLSLKKLRGRGGVGQKGHDENFGVHNMSSSNWDACGVFHFTGTYVTVGIFVETFTKWDPSASRFPITSDIVVMDLSCDAIMKVKDDLTTACIMVRVK